MKNNKLFSVILALLVCFSLAVSASATNDNELIFALESLDSSGAAVDTAKVKAGDEFTVTVNVEKNPGILAAIASLKYDAEVLELVSVVSATTDVSVKNDTGVVIITIGDTRAIFNPSANSVVSTTGAVATLTFKVVADKDLTSAVELVVLPQQVVGSDRTCSVNPVGDKLDVVVISATHNHADYEAIDAENAVEATCTEPGKESDMLCGHCGEIAKAGEEITALGHKEVVDAAVEATCKNSGLTEGKHCSVCNAVLVKQDVINALDHDFDVDPVVTKQPTCTAAGEQTYSCAYGCGETKVDNNVPAVGHKFGDWSVTKEATSDAEGEETRTCANCQEKEVRSIAKLPAKSNTGLIIGIVVVVVLAGAGVAAFFVLKNKKK